MRATDSFDVTDDQGIRHRVTQYAEPNSTTVIGGGGVPDDVRFLLGDGTELEPMMGAQQFVDRRTGRAYFRS